MALSLEQLYQVARAAGFPSATAIKMVAIAMKESGGNPLAHNAKPPDDSYGLWQINMLGALGPSRRQQLGISDNSALYDPAVNARMAYILWAGDDSNLNRHWAVNLPGYNATTFQKYLPLAAAAAARVDVAPAAGSSSATPDWSGFQSRTPMPGRSVGPYPCKTLPSSAPAPSASLPSSSSSVTSRPAPGKAATKKAAKKAAAGKAPAKGGRR